MAKYCMLRPISSCNAGLTLGIAFSVDTGVGPAAEPKVFGCSRPQPLRREWRCGVCPLEMERREEERYEERLEGERREERLKGGAL